MDFIYTVLLEKISSEKLALNIFPVDPLLIEHLLGLREDSSDGNSNRNLGVSS